MCVCVLCLFLMANSTLKFSTLINFAYLWKTPDGRCITESDAPLVLCFHGFPDSAYTFNETMDCLAEAGFRVVAPFMRGYFPTSLAPDKNYSVAKK